MRIVSGPSRLRRPVAFFVALAAMLGLFVATSNTAQADDGRSPTIRSEIESLYVHDWDIHPSGAQIDVYDNDWVHDNCAWGLADAGFKLGNSAEAHQRWHDNPQDLAGMLYAGLLNRAPDPGGLTTYTNAIASHGQNVQEGLAWATAAMEASDEYHNRIAAICDDDVASAAMFDHGQAVDFAWNVLMKRALNETAVCLVMNKIQSKIGLQGADPTKMNFRDTLNNRQLMIQVAGEVTNQAYGQLDGTCDLPVTYIKAAAKIFEIVNSNGGDTSVFIQSDDHRSIVSFWMEKYFTLRIGPNPTQWTAYSGNSAEF